MSWNNNQRGGGNNFQAKPRDILSEEHHLAPLIEEAIKLKPELKNYSAPGSTINNATININVDGDRVTLPVPQVAMMAQLQYAIPHNHENAPPLKKFDTSQPACTYYAVYNSPVVWEQDPAFVYVPTFTRYVINREGVVKNAYNGLTVQPENDYLIQVVPDGPTNRLRKTPISLLKFKAFEPTPDSFVDYGFGNHSHMTVPTDTNKRFKWEPRSGVVIMHNPTGNDKEFSDIYMFQKCAINKFEEIQEISRLARDGLDVDASTTVGDYSIKLKA